MERVLDVDGDGDVGMDSTGAMPTKMVQIMGQQNNKINK